MNKKVKFIVGMTALGAAGALLAGCGEPKLYKIIFVSDSSETIIPPLEVEWGKTPTLPETPVKTGYTFTGWSSNIEFNIYNESSETRWKGNSDTVLTANYSANTYTVSFNADNGGSNPSSQSVTFGSSYGTLPSPTKTGYDFEGWYTSASGGSKVTITTLVSIASNHTLYARYTPKNITVTFDKPCALQIDGDVVKDVLTYTVDYDK